MERSILILFTLFCFSACTDNVNPSAPEENHLEIKTGSVVIQLSFSSSSNEGQGLASAAGDWYHPGLFDSGVISLSQSGTVAYQESVNIADSRASGSIAAVSEGKYELTVQFYDAANALTFEGTESIRVLPGETTIGNVELVKQF